MSKKNENNETNAAADLFEDGGDAVDGDTADDDANNFEKELARLEEIVDTIESGGLGLEKSMEIYEEGIKKITVLTKMLEGAREKVMKLVSDSEGNKTLEDFEEEAE